MLDQLQPLDGVEHLQDAGAGVQPGGVPVRGRVVPSWNHRTQGVCQYFEKTKSGLYLLLHVI